MMADFSVKASDTDVQRGHSMREFLKGAVMMLRFWIVAALLATAACTPSAKTGCPDRYEGQTTSVTGTVTSSASALGLAYLTTVKDAAGSICLLVSRAPLGSVGATITADDQIATTNSAKTPPKYLYPAADPDLGR